MSFRSGKKSRSRRTSGDSSMIINTGPTSSASAEDRIKAKRDGRRLIPSMKALFPVYMQLDLNLDWKVTGIGLLVETLQLIGLTLNPNFNWGPGFGGTFAKIVYFFDFPLFDPGWADNTFLVSNVFLWLFLVLLAAWAVMVQHYTSQDFHAMPKVIVLYARTVLHAIVSFGMIPMAMIFFSFLVCTPPEVMSVPGHKGGFDRAVDEEVTMKARMLYWYGQKYRYLSGYMGAAFAFGIVGLVLLLWVLIPAAWFVFDDMPDSRNLAARANCGLTSATTAAKFVAVLLFHVLISQGYKQPYAATMCAVFGVLGVGYVVLLPYYNLRMNQFRAGQLLVAAAVSGVAALDIPTDMKWHADSISTAVTVVLAVVAFVFGWFVTLARVNRVFLGNYDEAYEHRRALARARSSPDVGDDGDTFGLPADPREFPRYLPVNDLVFTHYPGLEQLLLSRAFEEYANAPAPRRQRRSDDGDQSDGAEGREMDDRTTDTTNDTHADTVRESHGSHGSSEVPYSGGEAYDGADIPLDPYVKAVLVPSDVELATRFLREHAMRTGNAMFVLPPPLCAYAARIYTKGMLKFPKSPEIQYQFCLFLAIYARRPRMCLGELAVFQQAFVNHLSLPLSYRVYRLSERLKRVLDVTNTHQTQLLALSAEVHKEILAAMSTFWDSLTSSSHNFDQLTHVADYIATKRDDCRAYYLKTLQNPNELVLLNYTRFLRDVMINEGAAQALRDRVAEEANMHRQQQAARQDAQRKRTGDGTRGDNNADLTAGAQGTVALSSPSPSVASPPMLGLLSSATGGGGATAAEDHWRGCQKWIASFEANDGTVSAGGRGSDLGKLAQSAREIRRVRLAVYVVMGIVMALDAGLIIFAVARNAVLSKMIDRISAASEIRMYTALGGVLVGQLEYFAQLGVPLEYVAPQLAAVRLALLECMQLVRTAHERLTQGDLYTANPEIANFINQRRTEIVESGSPSIEGPYVRVLTDLYSLGHRIVATFNAISSKLETPTLSTEDMEFIILNSQEGTFSRAWNHTVALYVKERNNYLAATTWVVIIFVVIAVFLLIGVFVLMRFHLYRISQTKASTINLFALIPQSYVEDLYKRSRERLRNFEREESLGASVAAGVLTTTTTTSNAASSSSHRRRDRSGPGGNRASDTGRHHRGRSAAVDLDRVSEMYNSGSTSAAPQGNAMAVAAVGAPLPHGPSNTNGAGRPALGTVVPSFTAHQSSATADMTSRSRIPRGGQGDHRVVAHDEDGDQSFENEFSIKRIEYGSSNDYGGDTGEETQLGHGGAEGAVEGAGVAGGNVPSSSWHVIKGIAKVISNPVSVVMLLSVCVVLSVVCFAMAHRLEAISKAVSHEIMASADFHILTGRYYEYMSTQGRHAQQYVVTGDIVHVERYYDFLRKNDKDAWFAHGIIHEQNTDTVAAVVAVRTIVNSALLRQHLAMWLASLYYGVPQEQKYLFARVNAVRQDYAFPAIQASAEAFFASYRPVSTRMPTYPDEDEALDPEDQFEIATNLVFDDYYQAHRFAIVDRLKTMVRTHTSDYGKLRTTQRRLWVGLVVMQSVIIVLFAVSLCSYLVRGGPLLSKALLLISLCVVVATLCVLGVTHSAIASSDATKHDYEQFLDAKNSSTVSLETAQDYALRIQQTGYPSAQVNWAANRADGAFNDSLTTMVTAYVTSVSDDRVTDAANGASSLFVSSQRLVYCTDITAALASKAHALSTPRSLDQFFYNRRLEGGYQPEFFLFGNRDDYYSSTEEDLAKPIDQQLRIALKAASGVRFETVTRTYLQNFKDTIVTIGHAISSRLIASVERMGNLATSVAILSAVLMGVTMLTGLYAFFATMLSETESITALARDAAAVGRRSGSSPPDKWGSGGAGKDRDGAKGNERTAAQADPTATTNLGSSARRRRLQAVALMLVTLISVSLFVGVLVIALADDELEAQNSHILSEVSGRDWTVIDTVIHAQQIWHHTDDVSQVSPHTASFIRSVVSALQSRQELYLGDGKSFSGLLTIDAEQDVNLFGSHAYRWERYKSACTPYTQALGTSVLDFPRPSTSPVTEEEMMTNLFAFGAENVVWQLLGIYLNMLDAPSAKATQVYELPFLSSFPQLTSHLHNSSASYFTARAASGTALLAAFLAVAILLLVGLAASMIFVMVPILQNLVNEEESTRLLLRMIPEHVRRDVPAITEFFQTGTINRDAELINLACRDLQSTALVVVANDDTILSATEEALRQFRRPAEEILGTRVETLFSLDRGAEFVRHREDVGCSRLTLLAGKETRSVGRRNDGSLFPVSLCVREVFTSSSSSSTDGRGHLSPLGLLRSRTSLTTNAASGTSVFVLRIIDLGIKSDLEFVRKLHHTLFDSCRQPHTILDTRGCVRMINEAATSLFGYTAKEMAGLPIGAFLYGNSERDCEEILEELLSKTRTFSAPITSIARVIALRKDQREIHLEMHMTTVLTALPCVQTHAGPSSPSSPVTTSSQKEVAAIAVHIRDVSQDLYVHQAELATRAIIDLSPVPVIIFDESSRVRTFSPAAERSWGCKAESVIGCPLQDLLAPTEGGNVYDFTNGPHSDLKHFLAGAKSLTGKRRDNGKGFLMEVRMRELIHAERTKSGRPQGPASYIGYFRDLSFETNLATRNVIGQSAFDFCNLPIIVSDDQARIIAVNPAAERVFGYGPQELVGKDVSVLMPEHVARNHARFVEAYRETGQRNVVDAAPRNEFARRADGRLFTVEISLKEIHMADLETDFRASVRAIPAVTGDPKGGPTGVATKRLLVAYIRETTEEIQSARMNSIHEAIILHAPTPMMSVNAEGVVQTVNPALVAMFGYPDDALVGRDVSQTLFPQSEASAAAVSPTSSTKACNPITHEHGDAARTTKDINKEAPCTTFKDILMHAKRSSASGILLGRRADATDIPTEVRVQELLRGEDKHRHLGLEKLFVVSLKNVARKLDVEADTFLERAFINAYPGSVVVISDKGVVRFLSDQARKFFGVSDGALQSGLHVDSMFALTDDFSFSGVPPTDEAEQRLHRARPSDSGKDETTIAAPLPRLTGPAGRSPVLEEIITAAGGPGMRSARESEAGRGASSNSTAARSGGEPLKEGHHKAVESLPPSDPATSGSDEAITLQCVRGDGLRCLSTVRVRKLRWRSRDSARSGAGGGHRAAGDPVKGNEDKSADPKDWDGLAGGDSSTLAAPALPGEVGHGATDEAVYLLLVHDPVLENAVQQSTAIKNAVLEQLDICTMQVDLNGTILSANDAFLKTFRYTSVMDLVGRNVSILAPRTTGTDKASWEADGVHVNMQQLEKLLQRENNGLAIAHEMLAGRADGTHIHVSVSVGANNSVVIHHEDADRHDSGAIPTHATPAPVGAASSGTFFLFIRDIDAIVQARNRQRLLHEILLTSPLAMLVVEGVTPSAPIRLLNAASQALFQRAAEEEVNSCGGIGALLTVNGHSILDAYYDQRTHATVVVDTHSSHAGFSHQSNHLWGAAGAQDDTATSFKASGHRKDGSTFPAMVHVAEFFYEETGKHSLLFYVEERTTQLLLEFERATSRTIEDATPYAIICFNEQREVVLFNRQAEKLFECAEADIIGKDAVVLVTEQAAQLFDSIFGEIVASNSHELQVEPMRLYRQLAKRLGSPDGDTNSVFPSEWVFYELTPTQARQQPTALQLPDGRIFVALVRDTSTATTDIIAGNISAAAMNALTIPFLTFSDAGVITMANAALTKLFGYHKSEDVMGHNVKMLLRPDVVARLGTFMQGIRDKMQQLQQAHGSDYLPEANTCDTVAASQVLYLTGKRKDGETLSLELLLGMLPPPEGAAATVCRGDAVQLARSTAGSLGVTWYGFLYEISDKVTVKKQLAFNETIAAMESLAVLFLDHLGTITYAGESARQLFGSQNLNKAQADLEGHPLSVIIEKAADFPQFVASCEAAMAADKRKALSTVSRRLDGGVLMPCTVQLKKASYGDSDDSYICLISSSLDYEGSAEATKIMDAVNDLSLTAIVVADDSGIIQYVNKKAMKIFGYDTFSEMVGQDLGTVMTPAEAAAHRDHLANYLRGFKRQTSVIGHTRRLIGTRKDQSSVVLDVSVDECVSVLGGHRFIAYMDDLTDMVQHEGAVRMANSVLSSIPSLTFVVSGVDGRILQASTAVLERLSVPKRRVVDHPLDAFFIPVDNPDGGATTVDQEARRLRLSLLLRAGQKPVVVLPAAGGEQSMLTRTKMLVSELDGYGASKTLLCLVTEW